MNEREPIVQKQMERSIPVSPVHSSTPEKNGRRRPQMDPLNYFCISCVLLSLVLVILIRIWISLRVVLYTLQSPPPALTTPLEIKTHKCSLVESNGWFDVPPNDWLSIKTAHFIRRQNMVEKPELWSLQYKQCPHGWLGVEEHLKIPCLRAYHNFAFFPSVPCPGGLLRMGPDDGGKFVCAPERLESPGCLVVSIGSNNQFEFEEEVLKWNKNCEIHIFDHTIEPINVPIHATFHKKGLGNDMDDPNLITIPELLELIGAKKRPITIWKMDCEGCEMEIQAGLWDPQTNIRQLLIEVHFGKNQEKEETLMEDLSKHGYVMFSKEINTLTPRPGCCVEYSFLRFDENYFN